MPDSDYSATGMFQFTHPVRGATTMPDSDYAATGMFQFTHPVRGATAT